MKNHFERFLIAVLILNSFNLFAQNNDSTKTESKRSRFSIGIIASPEYCYRSLGIGSNANSFTPIIVDHRNDRELPKLGFTAGVIVNYEISNRISIECGLNYSDKGYRYDLSGLTFGDMIDPRFGFVYTTQTVEDYPDSWIYHYTYIDVPFKFVYTFPGRKIQFTTVCGFIANILLEGYQTISSSKVELRGDFNDLGISASASAGVLYNFNSKFRVLLIPSFQHSLTSLVSAPINGYLWSAGLNVGGYYRI